MSRSEPFTLQTATGRLLHGLLDLPERPGRRPAVVVCHGFKGFMEWGFFPYLASLLAERGFVAVRFNFGGSGMRPGDELVTDPEAFHHATVTADLADLGAILTALGEEIAPGRIDPDRVALFGHSRGGGLALLSAAGRERPASLAALVTWAGVCTFDRLGAEDKETWRARGELAVVNTRTGQELTVGLDLLEDLEAHGEAYDLEAAATRRRAPWLIVHGRRDETVPFAEARRLARAAAGTRELVAVEEGDHTFGARHPFSAPSRPLIQALNATQTWLRRYGVGAPE